VRPIRVAARVIGLERGGSGLFIKIESSDSLESLRLFSVLPILLFGLFLSSFRVLAFTLNEAF